MTQLRVRRGLAGAAGCLRGEVPAWWRRRRTRGPNYQWGRCGGGVGQGQAHHVLPQPVRGAWVVRPTSGWAWTVRSGAPVRPTRPAWPPGRYAPPSTGPPSTARPPPAASPARSTPAGTARASRSAPTAADAARTARIHSHAAQPPRSMNFAGIDLAGWVFPGGSYSRSQTQNRSRRFGSASRGGFPRAGFRLGGWSVVGRPGVFRRMVAGRRWRGGWRCPVARRPWLTWAGRPLQVKRRLVERRPGRQGIRRGARTASGGAGSLRSPATAGDFCPDDPADVRHHPDSRDRVALSDCDRPCGTSIPGMTGRSIRWTVVRLERAFRVVKASSKITSAE